jgi:hypothetical protein
MWTRLFSQPFYASNIGRREERWDMRNEGPKCVAFYRRIISATGN